MIITNKKMLLNKKLFNKKYILPILLKIFCVKNI